MLFIVKKMVDGVQAAVTTETRLHSEARLCGICSVELPLANCVSTDRCVASSWYCVARNLTIHLY